MALEVLKGVFSGKDDRAVGPLDGGLLRCPDPAEMCVFVVEVAAEVVEDHAGGLGGDVGGGAGAAGVAFDHPEEAEDFVGGGDGLDFVKGFEAAGSFYHEP